MVRELTIIMAAATPCTACTTAKYGIDRLRVKAKSARVERMSPLYIHLFLPNRSANIPIAGPTIVSVIGYVDAISPTAMFENSVLGRYRGRVNSTRPKLNRIRKTER